MSRRGMRRLTCAVPVNTWPKRNYVEVLYATHADANRVPGVIVVCVGLLLLAWAPQVWWH
jgi:hypothetical protein